MQVALKKVRQNYTNSVFMFWKDNVINTFINSKWKTFTGIVAIKPFLSLLRSYFSVGAFCKQTNIPRDFGENDCPRVCTPDDIIRASSTAPMRSWIAHIPTFLPGFTPLSEDHTANAYCSYNLWMAFIKSCFLKNFLHIC